MLSTDKLTNYNNIQASVEKLTDKKIKAYIIEVLSDLSDEQLQTVNSHSDILDKILRGIEYFNKKQRSNKDLVYGKYAKIS
ncbi:hypothetical protein [Candidatus Mesenet endosymbiont of Phosphuga atrata]|uniref:hypothetical protein n=1 Tax=Candidatus Mesenet endosymbiont of Phosphuga atrata TaxID=3066221 RepID=UPI0030CB6777